MVKELRQNLKGQYLMVNGEMVKETVMEKSNYQILQNIKDCGLMTKSMDMEFKVYLMEQYLKVNG